MPCNLSKEVFGRLVGDALAGLAPQFLEALENIRVEVRDIPTARMQRIARRGYRLLGLYIGRPKTRQSVEDSAFLPDVIYLFQREIEAICETEAEVTEQVRITVLHELGHYFGLNESNLDELGYG